MTDFLQNTDCRQTPPLVQLTQDDEGFASSK